jgi:hypothetical protein
MIRERGLAG